MSNHTLYRLGGFAAILGLVLSFASYVSMGLLAAGALVMAVFVFALYRLFSHTAPAASLAVAVAGIGGAVVLAITALATGSQTGTVVGISTWAVYLLPLLVFGFLAYEHPSTGLPRLLPILGLTGGAFGLANAVLVFAGGGDYANPNNPALTTFIMGTYYPAMLPVMAWMVWTGIALMRSGPAPWRQPA